MPEFWLLGDPAYVRNDGSWEFFSHGPTHIDEYIGYREYAILDETVSIKAIELLGDMIDSTLIVKRALRKMRNV